MSSSRRRQARKKKAAKEARRLERLKAKQQQEEEELSDTAKSEQQVEINLSEKLEQLLISEAPSRANPLRSDALIVKSIASSATTRGSRFRRDRIMLSIEDMVTYKLSPGTIVSVETGLAFIVASAWPLQSVSSGSCMMSSEIKSVVDLGNENVYSVKPVDASKSVGECKKLWVSADCLHGPKNDFMPPYVEQYVRESMLNFFVSKGSCFLLPLNGRRHKFVVKDLDADELIGRITTSTGIVLVKEKSNERDNSSAFENNTVGGLEDEVSQVTSLLDLALKKHDKLIDLNVKPPRGILLFGPPGTGKTMIAKSVASSFDSTIFVINGAEIGSYVVGEAETRLESIFNEACACTSAIIFIDEIDALCPSRSDRTDDMHQRILSVLLKQMDGLDSTSMSSVAVIAATNRPNALDSALRRPGRFDREIEVGVPNAIGRLEILNIHLNKLKNNVSMEDSRGFAERLHGFVGADIMSLCREAAWISLKRKFSGVSDSSAVEIADLIAALKTVKPSALREVAIEVPNVTWDDIGGQENTKQQLKEAVEWPIKNPEAFTRMGIRPPQGVLLYGPPGCSKTLLAKAIATEGQMNFIAVKGPELFSKWVGESEKAVQEVFRKARQSEPSVIFFDEIDALATARGSDASQGSGGVADRVLSQLLTEMDGVEERKRVVVVAATNRPDILDSALLRPGRLDRLIYVPPPDFQARVEILKINLRSVPLSDDIDISDLAKNTAGFSGAEVAATCREAALFALKENINAEIVTQQHFLQAVANISPQITAKMIAFYTSFESRAIK